MPINQAVAIWCLATPAVIASVATLIALVLGRFGSSEDRDCQLSAEPKLAANLSGQPKSSMIGPRLGSRLVVAFGWWSATTAAVWGRQSFEWIPEEAWLQSLWIGLAFGLFLSGSALGCCRDATWRWVVAGSLSVGLAYVSLPRGEGWADMLIHHRNWMLLLTLSCLVNAWALDRLAVAGASRWLLWITLAGLGGPLMLASSSYGAVSEWALAAVAATAVCAIAASLTGAMSLTAAAFPAIATLASVTASARFYSYEDHPAWMFGLMLFQPALCALVDSVVPTRVPWVRVMTAAIVSALVVAACGWAIFLRQPAENW